MSGRPQNPMLSAQMATESGRVEGFRTIRAALVRAVGNREEAAGVLGIGRRTLQRYLRQYPELLETTTANETTWDRDPAASGWRSRAFLEGGWELIAYDAGDWEVRGPPHGDITANGQEASVEEAKTRALRVQKALST